MSKETLKSKICLKSIWPETSILFLALNNIHFLGVLGKSLTNNAPPTIQSSMSIFLPMSPTLLTLEYHPH